MGLQYRDDIERLLYHSVSGNTLMNDCCCDGCADPPCYRWEECCARGYGELPQFPRYIVLGSTDDAALGSPDCVVYNDCCYCNRSATTKPENVDPLNVVASVETTCSACAGNEGTSCNSCYCSSCDPTWPASITLTLGGFLYPFLFMNTAWTINNRAIGYPSPTSCTYFRYIPPPSGSGLCSGNVQVSQDVINNRLRIGLDVRNYDLFGCTSAPGGGAGGATYVSLIGDGDICDLGQSFTFQGASLFNAAWNESRFWFPEDVNQVTASIT